MDTPPSFNVRQSNEPLKALSTSARLVNFIAEVPRDLARLNYEVFVCAYPNTAANIPLVQGCSGSHFLRRMPEIAVQKAHMADG
jgi:hypothetical protein